MSNASCALAADVRDLGVLALGQRLVVALSGGPDSLCLAHILVALAGPLSLQLKAVHIDHGLREGSGAEGERLERLCRTWGLGFESIAVTVERRTGSLEADARLARWAALESAATAWDASAIATGHSVDDLVEGIVLNLLRGSGFDGLRGMGLRNGKVIRPLLGFSRPAIAEHNRGCGLDGLSDPHNNDLRFRRVLVRRRLLPELDRQIPDAAVRLLRLGRLAEVAAARLRLWGAQRLEGCLDVQGRLRVSAYLALPSSLRLEVLRQLWLVRQGEPQLSARHLIAWDGALCRGRPARLALPRGLAVVVGYDRSWLQRAEPASQASSGPREARLSARPCGGCANQEGVHLTLADASALSLGRRSPGLRMRIGGAGHWRKLQDLFVDAKVPREERDRYPIVFYGMQPIWIPQVAADVRWRISNDLPGLHLRLTGGQ